MVVGLLRLVGLLLVGFLRLGGLLLVGFLRLGGLLLVGLLLVGLLRLGGLGVGQGLECLPLVPDPFAFLLMLSFLFLQFRLGW